MANDFLRVKGRHCHDHGWFVEALSPYIRTDLPYIYIIYDQNNTVMILLASSNRHLDESVFPSVCSTVSVYSSGILNESCSILAL